jgi:hypothetical protein
MRLAGSPVNPFFLAAFFFAILVQRIGDLGEPGAVFDLFQQF